MTRLQTKVTASEPHPRRRLICKPTDTFYPSSMSLPQYLTWLRRIMENRTKPHYGIILRDISLYEFSKLSIHYQDKRFAAHAQGYLNLLMKNINRF